MSLASSDTDKFSSKVRKSSVDHDGPETKEPLERIRVILESFPHGAPFRESTRVIPVPEATGITIWTTTAGDDEREQDDADDDDDFEGGEPELEFAEEFNATEIVDADDCDEEDCDEDAWVYDVAVDPELDCEGGGCELVGGYDDVFEPVPSHSVSMWFFRGA